MKTLLKKIEGYLKLIERTDEALKTAEEGVKETEEKLNVAIQNGDEKAAISAQQQLSKFVTEKNAAAEVSQKIKDRSAISFTELKESWGAFKDREITPFMEKHNKKIFESGTS